MTYFMTMKHNIELASQKILFILLPAQEYQISLPAIFFKTCTCINWCIYLAHCQILQCFFIGFHQQLLIFRRSCYFCVYKMFYCFFRISLRGVKISFLKKKCAFFLSVFSKLCVKTYCSIRDYQMSLLDKFITWCKLELSTLPLYQLSLPSPTHLRHIAIK